MVDDYGVDIFEGLETLNLRRDHGTLIFEVRGVLGVRCGKGVQITRQKGDAMIGLCREDDVGESVERPFGATMPSFSIHQVL